MSVKRNIGRAITAGLEAARDAWEQKRTFELEQAKHDLASDKLTEEQRANDALIDYYASRGMLSEAEAARLKVRNKVTTFLLDSATGALSSGTPPNWVADAYNREGGGRWSSQNLLGEELELGNLTVSDDLTDRPPAVGGRSLSPGSPLLETQPRPPVLDPHFYGEGQPEIRQPPGMSRGLVDPHFFDKDKPAVAAGSLSSGMSLTGPGSLERPLDRPSSPVVDLTLKGDAGGGGYLQREFARDPALAINALMASEGFGGGVPTASERPEAVMARYQWEQNQRLRGRRAGQVMDERTGHTPLSQIATVNPETARSQTVVIPNWRLGRQGTSQQPIDTPPSELFAQGTGVESAQGTGAAPSVPSGQSGFPTFDRPLNARQLEALREIAPVKQVLSSIDVLLPIMESRADNTFSEELEAPGMGPLSGRAASLRQLLPGALGLDDDQFAMMKVYTQTLLNFTVRMITGAQMSQAEAVRIMDQIPTVNDRMGVFKAKLHATKMNTDAMAAASQMLIPLEDYYKLNPNLLSPDIDDLMTGQGSDSRGNMSVVIEEVK